MADPNLAHYTFVPWGRRGIGARIGEVDALAAAPGTVLERPELSVELVLDYVAPGGSSPGTKSSVPKTVRLLGPGDVIGLKPGAILRTVPFDGELNVSKNLMPFVEFYEEDFPWRYSPAKAAGDKLRPWMTLLILKEGEFKLSEPTGERPYIEIPAEHSAEALLPEKEIWAWAHVQVAGVVDQSDQVSAAVAAAPDRSLSRILCPRKLEPRTEYFGFIIPTFEAGRRAGLDLPTETTIAQSPAWLLGGMPHSPDRPNQWPVYHRFHFKTGEYGDFESLVRVLVPGPAGEQFGKRDLDISRPGFGMDGVSSTTTVGLEGALMPTDFERIPFPDSPGEDFTDALQEILDLSEDLSDGTGAPSGLPHPFGFAGSVPDDPIITPPAYGKLYAGVARVLDAENRADLEWLAELNLDPRSRAAAGLGGQVVQRRQEELVERAWQQLGDVESANQRLREAELAMSVSERLLQKHMAGAEKNRLLTFTGPLQRTVLTGGVTLEGTFRQSRVPAKSRDATFKRVARPQRPVMRRLFNSGESSALHAGLIAGMDQPPDAALSAAPPAAPPQSALSFAQVTGAVQKSISDFGTNGDAGKELFLQLLKSDVEDRLARVPPQDLTAVIAPVLTASLGQRLDAAIPPGSPPPQSSVRTEVSALIVAIGAIITDGTTNFAVTLPTAVFNAAFGSAIDGKSLGPVVVLRVNAPANPNIVAGTSLDEIQDYAGALGQFNDDLLSDAARPPPAPLPALGGVDPIALALLSGIAPRTTLAARVRSAVSGVPPAPPDSVRPLRPVVAYPVFPDPEFDDLRQISQDYVIPNFSQLRQNSLTLLLSNQRFIEAFLAGLNTEFGRELLWREFPTDQHGTYFSKFWDTRDDLTGDGRADIKSMVEWQGDLGGQSERAGNFLVLVVRGQLFEKYPHTVVYARRAQFQSDPSLPRVLADDADPNHTLYPAFQGTLEPDVSMFGFALDVDSARGHRPVDPGWFFVFQERPGQTLFGLDDPLGPVPPLPLASWDDLNWGHVQFAATSPNHIDLSQNAAIAGPAPAVWARTSADLAYVLLQDPVLFARHAEEMLP